MYDKCHRFDRAQRQRSAGSQAIEPIRETHGTGDAP
jgi:hypothetical protein